MGDSCEWAKKLDRHSCLNDCPFPSCLEDIDDYKAREKQALAYIADIQNKIMCPYCNSTDVWKHGVRKGVQSYRCKRCKRKFRNNGCDEYQRYTRIHHSAAIELKREGLTVKEIVKRIEVRTGAELPIKTVQTWLVNAGVRTYKERCDKVKC